MLAGDAPDAWERELESLRELFGAGDEQQVLADFFRPGWDTDFCQLSRLSRRAHSRPIAGLHSA